MQTSEPIASLDSPKYGDTSSPRPNAPGEPTPTLETCDTTFPGTDFKCFAYINNANHMLMCNLHHLVSNPDDPPSSEMKYPGPQPMSIDTSHFDTIRQGEYMISPKTDGVRCCMMFSDAINGVHTVSLFDRKLNQAFGVFIRNVPRAMYQGGGSLLDGELVMDRALNRWTFLIFDCVHLCSIPQFQKPYAERMRVAARCLAMSYVESPEDTLKLDVKTCTPLHMAPPTADGLQDGRYLSDGFVYMPVHDPIVFGHHRTFFKLKSQHSVDFIYQKGLLMIYNSTTRRHVRAGVLESGCDYKDGDVLECVLVKYDSQSAKRVWRVIEQRHDKTKANTLFVMEKTLLNMRENLSYETIRHLKC